jgi:hypothetical protein
MNGGTALRPAGERRRFALSVNVALSMEICYVTRRLAMGIDEMPRRSLAVFQGLLGHIWYLSPGQWRPTKDLPTIEHVTGFWPA